MKNFSHWENEILENLASLNRTEPVSMKEFLDSFYFKEQYGRALIIQSGSHYAVYFLNVQLFDDEEVKKLELQRFFELISLLHYLKQEGYICIFQGYETKRKTLYFFQDNFDDPKVSKDIIYLNSKGDYTSSPDSILNGSDKVIYKGKTFQHETFELISSTLSGHIIISGNIHELIKHHEKKQHEKPIEKNERKHINFNHLLIALIIGSLLISLTILGVNHKKGGKTGVISEKRTDTASVLKSEISKIEVKKDSVHVMEETGDRKEEGIFHDEGYFYGIDVSKWNGDVVEKIPRDDSLTFIICKATQGNNLTDPDFHQNWELIKERGFIRGAYHMFVTGDDPIEQADYFLSTLGKLRDKDIPPIIDIEQASISEKTKDLKNNMQNDLLLCLKHIELKTRRTPLIYTGTYFANHYLSHPELSHYPLWLADYTNRVQPRIPKTWVQKGYKIWQKTDSYNITSHARTDFDEYYGKKEDLYR